MSSEGNASAGPGPDPGSSVRRSDAVQKLIEGWGRTLLNALATGVAVLLIGTINKRIHDSLIAEPWRALFLMGPLAALAWWCWRASRRGTSPMLRGPFALFLVCYLSVFTLAAGSDLLVWRRTLVGTDEARLPRSWITPARLGDWRYALAQRPRAEPALFVVTVDPPVGETRESARFQLARLIAVAAADGARGIALDLYFDPAPSEADGFICRAAADAEAAGMSLIPGYTLDTATIAGRRLPNREPQELRACPPWQKERGHLLGYREPDGRVRAVPLRLDDPPGAEALGLRVAAAIAAQQGRELDPPAGDLFHFLEPDDTPQAISYADLAAIDPIDRRALLDGRFLLVGEASSREWFETPYGPRLGVHVHANVVQSLLAGRAMQRTPWWSGLLVILVACFVITHLAAHGAAPRRLVGAAALITALMILAALGLARSGVWVDVVYVIAAVWPLTGLLAWRGGKAPRPAAPEPRELQPAGGAE